MSVQQVNPVQAQAMVDSLLSQLNNAHGNIAARDGVIAVQAKEIETLHAALKELQAAE